MRRKDAIAEIRKLYYRGAMSGDLIEIIDAAFGWREFPDAMFYRSPLGLRFDLGGDLENGPLRFVQALDRARAVATATLSGSETLVAVVAIYGEKRATRRHSAAIQKLEQIGFPHRFELVAKVPQKYEAHIAEFGGDLYRHCYAAEFTNEEASVTALLWASIAKEMGIRPSARWIDTIHIADVHKRLALCAYDDRGMDVIGPSGSVLSSLYKKFHPWLLDYNRAEMDAKFSA